MSASDRCEILRLIAQACGRGCRKSAACGLLGLSVRTVQRWLKNGHVDQRKGCRAKPANALSQAERQHVLEQVCGPEYQEMSPKKIVPCLADEGIYIASESTIYRILRDHQMLTHRATAKPATRVRPKTLVAQALQSGVDLGYLVSADDSPWDILPPISDTSTLSRLN